MASTQENDSPSWTSYGNNYKRLMTTIPFVFAKKAFSLLFPIPLSDLNSPITLLDVAAGPAVFLSAISKQLLESNQSFPNGSRFLVTDYAEGMIEAARKSLEELNLVKMGIHDINCFTMDACDPQIVDDSTVSHLICMFGVMFFPDRARAFADLRKKLIPGSGRAVFGSWNDSALMILCDEFGRYVDPSGVSNRPPPETSPLNICRDPEVFERELVDAGYSNISIETVGHEFELENDDGLFEVVFTNPAIVAMHPEFCPSKIAFKDLRSHWQGFLHTHPKWLKINEEGKEVIPLHYVANLAVAHN